MISKARPCVRCRSNSGAKRLAREQRHQQFGRTAARLGTLSLPAHTRKSRQSSLLIGRCVASQGADSLSADRARTVQFVDARFAVTLTESDILVVTSDSTTNKKPRVAELQFLAARGWE